MGVSRRVGHAAVIVGSVGSVGACRAADRAPAEALGAHEVAHEAAKRLVAVPLHGCPPFYTAEVTLGGSQALRLIVDTGSTTTAVASATCASCADAGVSALYRPSPTPIDGTDGTDGGESASTTYGGGRGIGWKGRVVEDTVSLDPSAPAPAVRFVAITEQAKFLGLCKSSPGGYQGILGLGPTWAAMPGTHAFVDRLIAAGSVANVLAVELCSSGRGGRLWLGGFDAAAATSPPVYTPMTDRGMVVVSDLGVDGVSIGLPPSAYGDALLDTGSPVTQLPSEIFAALTSAVEKSAGFQKLGFGNWLWHTCFPLPLSFEEAKEQLDAALPRVTMKLGTSPSIAITAPASESYLRAEVDPSTKSAQWCPGIVETKARASFLVIGAPLMQAHVTIFDREHRRVGFAEHKPCTSP